MVGGESGPRPVCGDRAAHPRPSRGRDSRRKRAQRRATNRAPRLEPALLRLDARPDARAICQRGAPRRTRGRGAVVRAAQSRAIRDAARARPLTARVESGCLGLDAPVQPLLEVAAQLFAARPLRVARAPRLCAQDADLLVTDAVTPRITL